jgi:hypothetical protein
MKNFTLESEDQQQQNRAAVRPRLQSGPESLDTMLHQKRTLIVYQLFKVHYQYFQLIWKRLQIFKCALRYQ